MTAYKRLFLGTALSCLALALGAQTPEWQWAVRAGGAAIDSGQELAADSQGNQYLTGFFQGTASFGPSELTSYGSEDIFAAKLDPAGNFLWAVGAGGASYDHGWGIAVDNAGNAYVTGFFRQTATFGPFTLSCDGSEDVFVAKLDPAGNFLWAVRAGGISDAYGEDIVTDSAGNAYLTGWFGGSAAFGPYNLTSSGSYDVFAAKLDPAGNFLWAAGAGGTGSDSGYGISVDSAGNILLTGTFSGTANFGSHSLSSYGGKDVFTAKMDSGCNWLWAVHAGGTSEDYVNAIAVDGAGNAYLTGEFQGSAAFGAQVITSSGEDDIYAAKLDSAGSFLWVKRAGGVEADTGTGIAVDGSGNAYLTGECDGAAAFGPYTLPASGEIVYAAKLDSGGNFLWVAHATGIFTDYEKDISLDGAGNAYLTGSFAMAAFGPYSLGFSGSGDIFVAKLGSGVDIDDIVHTPAPFFQMSSYPNPFNPETTLAYTLPASGWVSLEIYNSRGQLVRSLMHEEQPAGEHTLIWNGKDDSGNGLASGLYLGRITSAGKQETRKLLLLK